MNRIAKEIRVPSSDEAVGIEWKSILISAHVESHDGQNLHILRSRIRNGETYEVEAVDGIDDEHAEASIFVSEYEIVLKTSCPDKIDSDATVMMTFDLEENMVVEGFTVEKESDPPIVIRNIDDDTIVMVTTGDDPVRLHPGSWNLQATAILDGRERTTLIRLTDHGPGREPGEHE